MSKRFLSLLFTMVLFFSLAFAQPLPDGISQNKKAVELFNKGMGQYDLMEYQNAIDLLKAAIEKDKYYIDAHDLLGQAYIKSGNLKAAEKTYFALYNISPDYWVTYFELGKITFNMMKYDSSATWFKTFLNYKKIPEDDKLEAEKQLKSCAFAANAVKNPVPFKPQNLGPGLILCLMNISRL